MSPSKVSTIRWDEFRNIINGQPRDSEEKHYGTNPVTGEQLWPVPVATESDVNEAVEAAEKAFESWSQVPFDERKTYLKKFMAHYMAHVDEMIKLLAEETGKPLLPNDGAELEAKLAVWALFNFHDGVQLPEETIKDNEKTIVTRYTPLGVVGAICPWNFPIFLSLGKVIPAVLAGNTVIVKPSPYTPYTSLKVYELAQDIFPPGVIQVLGGDDRVGPLLTAHPGIAKISFTGSTATGKRVMAACAATLKRVTLELGGNDAAIVCADVDIPSTAQQLVLGAFRNSGQVCIATKRIYIHQDIYPEMVQAMVDFTKTLEVGPPGSGAFIGPVQNKMQFEKVKEYFEDSKSKGYTFAIGEQDVNPTKGFFIKPTIIDNPPNDSRIVQEEPFGPIVPTQPWSDEEEVIRRTNATRSGLAACVFSRDVARAERIGRRLAAGSVYINSFEKLTPVAAFGGHKESGIGTEWGTDGLKSYCNAQVMHTYSTA